MSSELSPGVRRLCAVIDVEGYSGHDHAAQFALQRRLTSVVEGAIRAASVSPRRVHRQDRGDGALLLFPPGIDEARVVPRLAHGLVMTLDRERRDDITPGLRIRAALGQGVVHVAASGFVGRVVVEVCRLVDSGPTRYALSRATDADVCLVLTDSVFADVVRRGTGGVPTDAFHVVRMHTPEKGFTALGWVATLRPDDVAQVGLDRSASAGAVLAVGAAAGTGVAAMSTLDDRPRTDPAPEPDDLDPDPDDPEPEHPDLDDSEDLDVGPDHDL